MTTRMTRVRVLILAALMLCLSLFTPQVLWAEEAAAEEAEAEAADAMDAEDAEEAEAENSDETDIPVLDLPGDAADAADAAATEGHPIFEERLPLAIMINNHSEARPQSGLSQAKLIYELLTEGGITRYLLLTDAEEGAVGPIRSARPAFFELVAEWDAIYCHVGNYEYVEISPLREFIKDMDAFFYGGGAYYRTSHRYAPHNLYADFGALYDAAKNEMGWDIEIPEDEKETKFDQLLVADEPLDRSAIEDALEVQGAKTVDFSYSSEIMGVGSASTHEYRYDPELEAYVKYTDGEPLRDEVTGEIVPVKNVVFMRLPHVLMENGEHWSIIYTSEKNDDGTNVPREGFFMNGGKIYPIEYTRENRESPTRFTLNGEALVLDPGLTFIQVLPEDASITPLESQEFSLG